MDKAFTEDEKKQIMNYPFEADTNPEQATSFPWLLWLIKFPAIDQEVSMGKYGFESVYNIARATRETETGTGVWWLRTNGGGDGLIADVTEDGCGVYTGEFRTWNELTGEARTAGIRPVIHLNLKGADFENAGSIKRW